MKSVADFVTFLRNERGLADASIEVYERSVRLFQGYLAGRPPSQELAGAWLSGFEKGRTRSTYAAGLRLWMAFLGVPFKVRVKLEQSLPKPVAVEDLRRMLLFAQGTDQLVILTFAFAGLRLSEITGLRCEHIQREALALRLFGKGRKERLIEIPPTLHRRLIEETRGRLTGPLWSRRSPRKGMSESAYYEVVVTTGRAAGVKVHPHQLRHFFATWTYALRPDAFYLGRMLGHTDPKTSYGYAGLVTVPSGIHTMEDLLKWVTA